MTKRSIVLVLAMLVCACGKGNDKELGRKVYSTANELVEMCHLFYSSPLYEPIPLSEGARAGVALIDGVLSLREGFPKTAPDGDYRACYQATKTALDRARAGIDRLIRHQEAMANPPSEPATNRITGEPMSLEETQQDWMMQQAFAFAGLAWEVWEEVSPAICALRRTTECAKLTEDLGALEIGFANQCACL